MIVFKTIKTLQHYLNEQKGNGKTVGFVPTMGALHQGHLSLIQKSLIETDITICSIFVNPTQFNNSQDLEKYPRTSAQDMKLLVSVNCHVLFLPNVIEMYPNGLTKIKEDYGTLTKILEGEKRPGHFDGVITIVSRFFEIINPNKTFFGQKDFQQCMVVKELIKRHFNHIELFIEPTKRQIDGLAMSSRNSLLSDEEKNDSLAISQALNYINNNWGKLTVNELLNNAKALINKVKSLKIEYLQICNKTTLALLEGDSKNYKEAVILTAVFCGEVRLIDNLIVYK